VRISSADLRRVPHQEFRHPEVLKGRAVTGVSTDSRTTAPGDLFLALRGPQFDGHKFLGAAVQRGAIVAVVDAAGVPASDPGIPLLVVEDTTRALGDLARIYREKFSIPILAVGGSNGKTTTKDMITAVLGTTYNVLSTTGNLNNHVGVPQTIFRLDRKHEIAVVEVGTNHPGEIQYLCSVLRPTHGVITNIGHEHLEFFGSIEGVAAEETMLWNPVFTPGLLALVNADDSRLQKVAKGLRKKTTFGFTRRGCKVQGSRLRVAENGCATFAFRGSQMKKPLEVQLSVAGRHNGMNALAAAAAGLTFRVKPTAIRDALEGFQASDKRMELIDLNGIVILNDTYNANPDSMRAALQTLSAMRVTGNRIAVLADMLELGDTAQREHARIGEDVRGLDIDYVLTYGTLARHISDGAGAGKAMHYHQKNMLSEYLLELVAPGDAVLLKGSRGMKMEDVVAFLQHMLTVEKPSAQSRRDRR
jgi:UDP-N-acetylmuramoyl-tripeptide--D-alanyl-D-alanine ligase